MGGGEDEWMSGCVDEWMCAGGEGREEKRGGGEGADPLRAKARRPETKRVEEGRRGGGKGLKRVGGRVRSW